MDWIEISRNVLTFIAGVIAIAILAREAHVWWLNRRERKTMERMQERYWQEVTDEAVQYVEDLYSGKVDRP